MQYVQRIKYALSKVQHEILRRKELKIQRNADKSPDTISTFNVGDKVGLQVMKLPYADDHLSNKLYWEYTGPYTISRRGRNDKVYYIKDAFGDEVVNPISIERIRKWVERDPNEKVIQPLYFNNEEDFTMDVEEPLRLDKPDDAFVPESKDLSTTINEPNISSRSLRNKNNSTNDQDQIVGKRIEVQWPNGKWYPGEVIRKCTTKIEKAKGSHIVKYEDDNQEYYEKLNIVKYRLCK